MLLMLIKDVLESVQVIIYSNIMEVTSKYYLPFVGDGKEVIAYLKFIMDFYNNGLPRIMVLLHGTLSNDDLPVLPILQYLNWQGEHVQNIRFKTVAVIGAKSNYEVITEGNKIYEDIKLVWNMLFRDVLHYFQDDNELIL